MYDWPLTLICLWFDIVDDLLQANQMYTSKRVRARYFYETITIIGIGFEKNGVNLPVSGYNLISMKLALNAVPPIRWIL